MDNKKLIPIGILFKKSYEFYKINFYKILLLALIPFAIFSIYSFLDANDPMAGISNFFAVYSMIFFLLYLIVTFLTRVNFFYLIKNPTLDIKSLMSVSWKNIASFARVSFLVGIICVGWFVLLVIPGIIFTVWFSLSLYVFVFEGKGGMSALYRSKDLVSGYWWPVFLRMLIFGIISSIIGWFPVIGSVVGIFFLIPVGVIYSYYIYDDLRMIKA